MLHRHAGTFVVAWRVWWASGGYQGPGSRRGFERRRGHPLVRPGPAKALAGRRQTPYTAEAQAASECSAARLAVWGKDGLVWPKSLISFRLLRFCNRLYGNFHWTSCRGGLHGVSQVVIEHVRISSSRSFRAGAAASRPRDCQLFAAVASQRCAGCRESGNPQRPSSARVTTSSLGLLA